MIEYSGIPLDLSDYKSIRDISNPLTKFGITDFVYLKYYKKEGRMINLGSNPAWAEFYFSKLYSQHYKKEILQEHNHFINDIPIELWFFKENNEFWKDTKNNFDIANGITIEKFGQKYKEVFYFAAHKNNYEINNFYLNNLDLLNKFIFYFKDKASKLIAQYEQKTLEVPSYYRSNNQPPTSRQSKSYHIETPFLDELSINKYHLGESFKDQYLTKRELECVKWIGHGKKMSEIAEVLGVSSKTIETHVSNIKTKLNCFKSAQLVYKLYSLLSLDPREEV